MTLPEYFVHIGVLSTPKMRFEEMIDVLTERYRISGQKVTTISFIDGRAKEDKKTKFWMLKKKNEVTFCTAFERNNPIKTTYALLWSEVKENSDISSVSLQNAMRRILENFFGTLGNANSATILQYFETTEEKAICRSLFSWANDGSHSIPDDLEFSENTDAPEKYRKRTNLSISEFVRRMAAEQVIREAPHVDVPRLWIEVKRVGNNINQLLVLANSKGFFDKAALTAALEELREVDNLIFDAYTKS